MWLLGRGFLILHFFFRNKQTGDEDCIAYPVDLKVSRKRPLEERKESRTDKSSDKKPEVRSKAAAGHVEDGDEPDMIDVEFTLHDPAPIDYFTLKIFLNTHFGMKKTEAGEALAVSSSKEEARDGKDGKSKGKIELQQPMDAELAELLSNQSIGSLLPNQSN